MRTGGAGTEEGSGVSTFRWALYNSLTFRVVRSWDADIGLDECTRQSVNWQAVCVRHSTSYCLPKATLLTRQGNMLMPLDQSFFLGMQPTPANGSNSGRYLRAEQLVNPSLSSLRQDCPQRVGTSCGERPVLLCLCAGFCLQCWVRSASC